MIAPTPFFSHRGTHIRILEEARSLERLGHDITIATYHNGDDVHEYIESNIDVRRIRRWLFWYKKTEAGPDWQKIILNLLLIKKVLTLTCKQKPSILHAHLHEGVLIGRIVQMILFWQKITLISDFHGSLVKEMRSHGYLHMKILQKFFQNIECMINRIGEYAIVSSKENVKLIKQARRDKKVQHIGDGVDLQAYYKIQKNIHDDVYKKYNIDSRKCIVLYTGALIANKGIDYILHAIEPTIKQDKGIHFVIGGFPAEQVRDFVIAQKLEKYVTIISPLSYFNLAAINAVADIAVDPKDHIVRQASGKILQYMAADCAIICADRATNHGYLNKKSAVFLSEMNSNAIKNAILLLKRDQEKLMQYKINAKKDVLKYSWQQVGIQINTVYHYFV